MVFHTLANSNSIVWLRPKTLAPSTLSVSFVTSTLRIFLEHDLFSLSQLLLPLFSTCPLSPAWTLAPSVSYLNPAAKLILLRLVTLLASIFSSTVISHPTLIKSLTVYRSLQNPTLSGTTLPHKLYFLLLLPDFLHPNHNDLLAAPST